MLAEQMLTSTGAGLAFDLHAFGDDAVLGCEFVGTIVQVHPSVSKLAVGDRIAALIWGGTATPRLPSC